MVKVESALLLFRAESIIKLVQMCNNGTSKAQRMCKTNGGHSGYVEICGAFYKSPTGTE